MRRCAYWHNLNRAQEVNVATPTVHIPKSQVFDVPGVRYLMEQSRNGNL